MTDDRRIELEIEVPGTPEEVWRAIATGPGISSWYVPHVVEEREGGAASASFGPGESGNLILRSIVFPENLAGAMKQMFSRLSQHDFPRRPDKQARTQFVL